MKKLILIFAVLLTALGVSGQNYFFTKPITTTLNTADILLLYQSGSTKNFTIGTWANVLNDTADILRAELPPLWRTDIADTATQLRLEIDAAATIDTAWTKSSDNYVILKYINDSIGIGTTTPTEKFHVNGLARALGLYLDDGYTNILIGPNAGNSITADDGANIFIGYNSGSGAGGSGEADGNIGLGYSGLGALTNGNNNMAIGNLSGDNISTGISNVLISDEGSSLATGNYNLFAGYRAGKACAASSSNNVFLGSFAGYDADIDNAVGIGYQALYNYDNAGGVGIGYYAGQAATSSIGLVAVGYQAADDLITSDYHTAVGYQALAAVQASDGSSVFGYQAGNAATGANALSLFGYLAGTAITTGDYNTIFGSTAGDAITTSGSHSIFGYGALGALQTSQGSSVFGYLAGSSATSADGLTAVGYRSGNAITTGDNNTLTGFRTGNAMTEGNDNTLFGYYCGDDITIGDQNTLFGSGAGSSITSGGHNTIVGYNAGDAANITYSTLFGENAGTDLSAGASYATLIGYNAGENITSGDYNTLIGHAAGSVSMTTGANNTALGYWAATGLNGSQNTVLGSGTGDAVYWTGNDNTLIGYNAGTELTGVSDNNTLVGSGTGAALTTEDGNIMIGYQAGGAATVSNQLFIDNSNSATSLIWGDFSSDSLVVNGELLITDAGSYTSPSIALVDGNTGFYEGATDDIYITLGGGNTWYFDNSGYFGVPSNGCPVLRRKLATATTPNIIPTRGDYDTGLGGDDGDTLSLIAGGVQGVLITETDGVITILATDTLRALDYAGGANAWTNESDRRLKENINPIENGLQKVLKLQGVEFEWKDNPAAGKKIGFIAQDVEKVVPEVVHPGNPYSMETSQLVAVLVEAMKEQQKQIESQQKQIDKLMKKVNRLKSK